MIKCVLENSTKPWVTHSPLVLITGDGRCLTEDLYEFEKWQVPHDVFCCCRSIQYHSGPVDHWGDVDAMDYKGSWYWAGQLASNPKWRNGPQRHTIGEAKNFDFDWTIEQAQDYEWSMDDVRWYGSTSMFAILACLEMGYKKIILAGCPMDSDGHWYSLPEEKGPRWAGFDYQYWLDFARKSEAHKVRSMSGYTAQIVGEATKEWALSLHE